MQTLARKVSLPKSAFAAFFFALIPSLVAGQAICFGSSAVMNWGQFLTAPPLLAMCHLLSILWFLGSNKGMWRALKLLAAFVVLVLTHATAMSLGTYQYDFPVFCNQLIWHATFAVPSTVLIGAITFIVQPYLSIVTVDADTMNPKHSIVGFMLVTATVACVITFIATMNSFTVGQFLLSHLALGTASQLCLWSILSRQYTTLRYTVLVTTMTSLLLTTGILFANRMEACGDILEVTLYVLCLTGFVSMERFIGFQFPHRMHTEPQNNNPLDTKPSISCFDLR